MRRMMLFVAGAALVVAVVTVAVSAFLANGPSGDGVEIRDLGTLGGAESAAVEMNGRGQVVGWSITDHGTTHGFLWANGKMSDLPPTGGFQDVSGAVAVADSGVVAGNIHPNLNTPDYQAVVWLNGKLRKLPTLGGTDSWVLAMNERNQIVGGASDKSGATHAVLWKGATVTDLGVSPLEVDTPDGALEGGPTDINERGQVVGSQPVVRFPGGADWGDTYELSDQAFLWQQGRLTMLDKLGSESLAINDRGEIVGGNYLWHNRTTSGLGTLPGRPFTTAVAINEHGQVIGSSYGEGNYAQWDQRHAFIWQKGKITDLGTLPWRAFSQAVGLNERGQVAGFSCDEGEGNCRAFVWERGRLTDLGTLPGGNDSRAVAINDRGQVAGYSTTKDGQRHAVLWTLRSG